jgi:translocation and assembly module TamB
VTRRKLVALVAVIVFVLLGIVGVSTIFFLARTERGREQVRAFVGPLVARRLKGGDLYLGRISQLGLSEITIDTIALRDKRGELFLSTGRVTVGFDIRDLIDQRLYIRRAQVAHPYVHLIQHENDSWNFREIFASEPSPPPLTPEVKRRGFTDYIVIDSARTTNGTFLLTLPWHPDKGLTRAQRDSVIKVHLETPSKAVSRRFDGYGRLYAWRNLRGILTHARLADPDSDKAFGKEFFADSLAVDEFEPTFQFTNVRAHARVLGDSVWFEAPHFNLPASVGHGTGKVWWGHGPVRYDIAVRGDSVSLDDVNWVYPYLPRTGGGALDLFIRNDPKNPQIIEYKLSKMDVRSTKSHITGDMTFGTGQPVLLVRDVNLRADPIDFDLIRTFNGKPFPMDWQGQIFGTAKGRGGPLTNFVVDEAHGEFRDAHVPGAVSRFSAKGELDILYPAFTAFHNFHVDVASLDLRTPEFLNPNFPRLGGTISGTATLDSSWLDVRFSNADITHRDGPGEPSRFTGSGRVTYDTLMIYDVAVDAAPLSLTMLARSYPNPLRGLVSGPIRVKGVAPDLELQTTLQNSVAGFSFDGRVDADSVGGYGARGRGQFTTPNIGGLLSLNQRLVGPLGVHYDVDVNGISATEPGLVRGSAALDVERTELDSVRYSPARLRFRFADGELRVDSANIRTSAARIELAGGISLPRVAARDSIKVTVNVDSLGGLRPYISHPDTTLLGAANTPPDSLAGTATLNAYLTGSLDVLNTRGELSVSSLYFNKDRGESGKLGFDLRNVLGNYYGAVDARIDTVTLAGIMIDTIGGRLTIADSSHGKFDASAISRTGQSLMAVGDWARSGDTSSIRLSDLAMNVGDARWRLASPAHFTFDSLGTRLDSLLLHNGDSGVIVARGSVPQSGTASGDLRVLRLPLRDLGALAQLSDTITGVANVTAAFTGTRLAPRVTANAGLTGVRWYGVDVDSIGVTALAQNRRLQLGLDVVREGKPAVTAKANLPVEVTLFSARAHDESVSGTLHAEPTDLGLLNAFLTRAKTRLAGQLSANVTAAGTWTKPTLEGRVSVRDGTARISATGVDITNIEGSADWGRNARGEDSVIVSVTAEGGKNGGSVSLSGYAKNLFQPRQTQPLKFALVANDFHAFRKLSLADLYVSTLDPARNAVDTLWLRGTVQAPVLTGPLNVDRGSIFLADRDIARKQAVEVFEDTPVAVAESRSKLFSTLMANVQPNVTITLGDVRLRSAEANVKLTGELHLTTSTARSTRTSASTGQLLPQFALEGRLNTAGGSYNLNLGPVSREFQVLNGGTVTFDGPWQNPNLDIRAIYNVRRQGDRDLGIIVSLEGPLVPYPGIDFNSDAGYEISQSDLISYLLIGKPGFDFGQNPAVAQVVSSVLGPSLSAYAASKLRQSPLGSVVDLRLQLGTTNQAAGTAINTNTNWSQYLYGSTLDVEQQFKNVFLSANVGFCQFQQNQTFSGTLNALGAKAEYRFNPKLSLKLSYDPPSATRVCNQQTITGFQLTPWQFGLSLLHTWRF